MPTVIAIPIGSHITETEPRSADLIFKFREALSVRTGLALQYDGAAVRYHQPSPDQKYSILAEGDLAVVGADEIRSLRDQQEPAEDVDWSAEVRAGRLRVGAAMVT